MVDKEHVLLQVLANAILDIMEPIVTSLHAITCYLHPALSVPLTENVYLLTSVTVLQDGWAASATQCLALELLQLPALLALVMVNVALRMFVHVPQDIPVLNATFHCVILFQQHPPLLYVLDMVLVQHQILVLVPQATLVQSVKQRRFN